MLIDYTTYEPGMALAAKIFLEQCPVCGATCHAKHRKRGHEYVHEVQIIPDLRRSGDARLPSSQRWRVEVKSACHQTVAEFLGRPAFPGKP